MQNVDHLVGQIKISDLINDLQHGSLNQRKHAVMTLGLKADDPQIVEAVEPLIQVLRDEDSDLRSLSAMSLGFLKDERSVLPLISALQDSYFGCRQMAARSLGWTRDPRAMSYLFAATDDQNTEVQEAAAQALVDMEDLNTVDSVISLLTHSNPKVRSVAVIGLNKLTKKKFIWGNKSKTKWQKWWNQNKERFFT